MKFFNYQMMGKGPDLILLHGFAMSSIFLKPFAEQLSQCFRVHLFDLPGFGEAYQTTMQEHPELLANDLLKLLPPKAIWIGWSLGGLIASWIALHHPERVIKLVNIASSPYFLAAHNWPGIAPKEFAEFSHALKQDYFKTLLRFLNLQMTDHSLQKKTLKLWHKTLNAQPAPNCETLESAMNLMASTDLRQALMNLQMPCLYLFGGKDRLVPVEISQKLSKNIQILTIPDAAHLPFISHEKICLSTIESFLNEPTFNLSKIKNRPFLQQGSQHL